MDVCKVKGIHNAQLLLLATVNMSTRLPSQHRPRHLLAGLRCRAHAKVADVEVLLHLHAYLTTICLGKTPVQIRHFERLVSLRSPAWRYVPGHVAARWCHTDTLDLAAVGLVIRINLRLEQVSALSAGVLRSRAPGKRPEQKASEVGTQ